MTRTRSRLVLHGLTSLVVALAAASAFAAPPPDDACRGAKLKAAGKYAAAVLGCDAKAAKDASAVDPACLTKGEGKLNDAFATAESKTGVECNGIDLTMQVIVDDTAAGVVAAAPVPGEGGTCVSLVHKSAGKFASSFLGAWSKFVTTGDATKRDEALAKARTSLAGKISKAETKDGCTSTGQGEAVRTAVEDGLAPLLECLASSETCIEEVEEVPAGGSATTDPAGTGPDTEVPITAEVETPNAGTIVLRVVESGDAPPDGFALLGHQVEVTAPDATVGDPLVLTFVVDASLLPPDPNTVTLARDGVPVADCSGAPGTASPDPCLQSRTVLGSGDLELVCLSSHASLWTPLVALPAGCPTAMLWEMRADAVGDDRATEIDVGWRSAGHNFDPASGSAIAFALDCTASEPPCGTCTVTGFDPSPDNCRCANNPRTVCDEPGAADANDCGGSTCECYTRSVSPVVIGGTPACIVGVANADSSGSWNVEAGSGDVTIAERIKVFIGNTMLSPCPTCVGDTPGDGVRSGTCSGGASNGQLCDAQASDPTFPYPGGGFYSVDCMPNAATNITGLGVQISHTETTGSASLASGIPCAGAPSGMCPCAVCSLDGGLACSSDADCSGAGAGTCTSTGGGTTVQPDNCGMDDCAASVDGEAQCQTPSGNRFCNGLVEEDGRGVIACASNTDCDAQDGPGFDAGSCTILAPDYCFDSPITATGAADPDEPRTVAITCVPPTSNGAVNNVFGLPGPGRVRTDWFVTMLQ
jgi:hypothetical protein